FHARIAASVVLNGRHGVALEGSPPRRRAGEMGRVVIAAAEVLGGRQSGEGSGGTKLAGRMGWLAGKAASVPPSPAGSSSDRARRATAAVVMRVATPSARKAMRGELSATSA